jgi:hypothetical protein
MAGSDAVASGSGSQKLNRVQPDDSHVSDQSLTGAPHGNMANAKLFEVRII